MLYKRWVGDSLIVPLRILRDRWLGSYGLDYHAGIEKDVTELPAPVVDTSRGNIGPWEQPSLSRHTNTRVGALRDPW